MSLELKIRDFQDELNLYLTSNKLKPASTINLDVYLKFENRDDIIRQIILNEDSEKNNSVKEKKRRKKRKKCF
jgi:ribosomal protein S6